MATSRKNFKVTDNLDVAGTGASTIAGSLNVGVALTLNGKAVATVDMLGQNGSGITWLTVTNANVNPAVSNTGYLMETGGTLRTITLPANVPAGFYLPVKAIGGQVRIAVNGNTIVEVGTGNNLVLDDGNIVTLVATATGTLRILQGGSSALQHIKRWTVLRTNTLLSEDGGEYLSVGELTHTLPTSVLEGTVFVLHAKGQTVLLSNGNVITGVGAGNDLVIEAGNTAHLVASDVGELEIV